MTFCVVASEYVPVAVNCCVAPTVSEGFTGVTAMAMSVVVTVMLSGFVTVCGVAEESVTRAVKLNVPLVVGVPVIAPVDSVQRQPGRQRSSSERPGVRADSARGCQGG